MDKGRIAYLRKASTMTADEGMSEMLNECLTEIEQHDKNKLELDRDLLLNDKGELKDKVKQLQADNKEIKMLLGRYGRHDPKCESLMNDKVCPCTCGYDEIIARFNGEKKSQNSS